MKNTIIFAALSLLYLSGFSRAAVVNFTTGEGYVTGAQLNSHPDWVAQTPWTAEAVGDGVARETSGAFIRANYQAQAADNNVGDYFEAEATFSLLGSYSAPAFNLATSQEYLFILDVTEQTTATPPLRMGAVLVLEDEVDPDELHLRILDGFSVSTNLGAASLYDGHTFTLTVRYTRLDAFSYSATASIDSHNDGAGPFEITDPNIMPDPDFSAATSVYGVMQSAPAATLVYSGVEVDQFKFAEPDLVPSTPVLLPDVVFVEAVQFQIESPTRLQVKTNLTDSAWQDVAGTEVPGPTRNARFIDSGTGADPERFYRIAEPAPIFSDDFEGADTWTVTTPGAGVTWWELGTPNLNTGFSSLYAAASGLNCWGTDLDSDYATGTDTTLTSPAFDLPATGPLMLEWNEWVDMDPSPAPGDQGFVSIRDVVAGTNVVVHTSGGSNPVWNPVSVAVPDSLLGRSVQIEFQFLEDNDSSSSWGGWYIDDVQITD